MPRHEEATDPTYAAMDDQPRDGLMALVHATKDRGLGIGMYPDECDLAGLSSYSSETLTRVVSQWIQHNERIANYVQGLPARQEFDALHADVMQLGQIIAAQQDTITLLNAALEKALRGKAA